ncbi:MAG: hypothetical protein ACYCZY_12410 [Lacisediminihabitans sp.]
MNGRRRNLLAAAGVVVAVVTLLSSCTSDPGASPSSPPVTPSPTTSPVNVPQHGPPCTSAALTAYFAGYGDALGTEITHILFRNISTTSCWFADVPMLFGITADGTVTKLAFEGTADPGYAMQPAQGPGELAPGKQGILIVTMQLNNCPVPTSVYQAFRTLRIQFPTGAVVIIPYPKPLAVTSCPGNISQVGLGTH